jgi:hypothetical protein
MRSFGHQVIEKQRPGFVATVIVCAAVSPHFNASVFEYHDRQCANRSADTSARSRERSLRPRLTQVP